MPIRKKKSKEIKNSPVESSSSREAKWDLLFSSAAITIGVALFFWIGWMYEAKWYGYYGINVAQLDLPVQNIVIQSIPILLLALFILALILIGVYVLRVFIYFFYFLVTKKQKTWNDLFSLDKVFKQTSPFVFAIYFMLVLFIIYRLRSNRISEDLDISYLSFIIISIGIFLAYRVIIESLLYGSQHIRVGMNKQMPRKTLDFRDQIIGYSLVGLLILFSSVLLSGFFGDSDAKRGFRYSGGGWGVEQVYIASPSQVVGLESFLLEKKEAQYIYGPFGYVAENKHYLYLIQWKAKGQEFFEPAPPLYLVDYTKGSPINVIPYKAYSPTEQPAISNNATSMPINP